LPAPLLTPTTKDADDLPITPAEIVATGLASAAIYAQMEKAALELFAFGAEYLRERGIILVDTKYEFGILPQTGELILIDELHTPDSSRFWWAADYAQNPQSAEQIDKEFLRRWLTDNRDEAGKIRTILPEYIAEETARRYLQIYEIITGAPLNLENSSDTRTRLLGNLRRANLIPSIRAAVLTGFGINCEEETAAAFRLAGAAAEILHVNEIFVQGKSIADYDIIAFAGGFSFGDDIASGRVLANKIRFRRLPNGRTLLEELKDFIAAGKFITGICNGFQMLTRLGLLPNIGGNFEQEASLIHNDSAQFEDRWVRCIGTGTSPTPFAANIQNVDLPIRHGEGKLLFKDDSIRQKVQELGLCVLQYADPSTGAPTAQYPANPNGAELQCAALCDTTGQVFALMPHPEAYLSRFNHPDFSHLEKSDNDYGAGLKFFENIVLHLLRQRRG
jgi:phosphoribosylformylglycinamidine synthase